MRKHVLAALAAGCLIAGSGWPASADDKEEAIKKDMKQLEGTWVVVSLEQNGTKAGEDVIKQVKLTIKGDKYTVELGERTIEMVIKIDPSKKPKAIDFRPKGDEKAVTEGIYELTEDTFKMCRPSEAGQKRPTEFASKEGSGVILVVYKREKK